MAAVPGALATGATAMRSAVARVGLAGVARGSPALPAVER